MFSKFEYRGSWHLPGNPDNKINGILSSKGNEPPILDLLGSLHSRKDIYSKNLDLKVILGETTEGKEITLIKCMNVNYNINSDNDISSFKFIVLGFVVIGGLFKSLSDLTCNNIYVNFNLLEDWLGTRSLTNDFHEEGRTITLKRTKPFIFQIFDGLEGEFSTDWNTTFSKSSEFDVLATKKSFLGIRTKDKSELPVGELIDIIFHFQRFLTLATGESIYPREIIIDRFSDDNLERLSLVYPVEYNEDVPLRKSGPLMPLTFPKIKDRFEEMIRKWYSNLLNLKPVQDLFFEVVYKRFQFNENSFLNTIQALETFHRRTKKSYVTDKEIHKEKITRILESVDDKYRSWLKDKLSYSNEPSLHQRIQEIISEYQTDVFIKLVPNVEKLIKEAKWSRNYYTHYDSRNEKKALKGRELYNLNQRLLILLKICFLSELGFKPVEIDKFVAKDSTYRMLRLNEQ